MTNTVSMSPINMQMVAMDNQVFNLVRLLFLRHSEDLILHPKTDSNTGHNLPLVECHGKELLPTAAKRV